MFGRFFKAYTLSGGGRGESEGQISPKAIIADRKGGVTRPTAKKWGTKS